MTHNLGVERRRLSMIKKKKGKTPHPFYHIGTLIILFLKSGIFVVKI
jgi:hypothetical protein